MIRVVHPGSGSRIPILIFYPPGSRIQGHKGTGSRIRNTGKYLCAIMCKFFVLQFMLSSRLWCGARRRSWRNWWSASRPRSGRSIRASPVSGGWAIESGFGPIRNGLPDQKMAFLFGTLVRWLLILLYLFAETLCALSIYVKAKSKQKTFIVEAGFKLKLNCNGGLFLLDFTVTSEIDSKESAMS